jgi:hypothetical protein
VEILIENGKLRKTLNELSLAYVDKLQEMGDRDVIARSSSQQSLAASSRNTPKRSKWSDLLRGQSRDALNRTRKGSSSRASSSALSEREVPMYTMKRGQSASSLVASAPTTRANSRLQGYQSMNFDRASTPMTQASNGSFVTATNQHPTSFGDGSSNSSRPGTTTPDQGIPITQRDAMMTSGHQRVASTYSRGFEDATGVPLTEHDSNDPYGNRRTVSKNSPRESCDIM